MNVCWGLSVLVWRGYSPIVSLGSVVFMRYGGLWCVRDVGIRCRSDSCTSVCCVCVRLAHSSLFLARSHLCFWDSVIAGYVIAVGWL